jgi:hypothetical protein
VPALRGRNDIWNGGVLMKNTTVTLPLNEFDDLRDKAQEYKTIAYKLAHCFQYSCIEHEEPQECKDCKDCHGEIDCPDCDIHKKNPSYTEKLTVDVERLIRVASEYALYGTNVETNIKNILFEKKKEPQINALGGERLPRAAEAKLLGVLDGSIDQFLENYENERGETNGNAND